MLPTNVIKKFAEYLMFQISVRFLLIYVSVSWFVGGNLIFRSKLQEAGNKKKQCSGISPAFIRNRDFHLVEARKLCDLPKTFGWMVETCKVGPEKPVISQGFKSQHTSHHSYQNGVVDVRKKSMAPCTRWASTS